MHIPKLGKIFLDNAELFKITVMVSNLRMEPLTDTYLVYYIKFMILISLI